MSVSTMIGKLGLGTNIMDSINRTMHYLLCVIFLLFLSACSTTSEKKTSPNQAVKPIKEKISSKSDPQPSLDDLRGYLYPQRKKIERK